MGQQSEMSGEIEMSALENNVIITGIQESPWEKYEMTKQCVYDTITSAMCGSSDITAEALSAARGVDIISCLRMGKYQLNRARPISVKSQRREDKVNLMSGKKNLPGGVFVNNEYPIEVKCNGDSLLPTLILAKSQPNYKKSRLNADRLIINRTVYTVNDLGWLAEDLAQYKAAQKTDEKIVAFHSSHSPCSNFHRAPFVLDGLRFDMSEQYIQYQKAMLLKDSQAA